MDQTERRFTGRCARWAEQSDGRDARVPWGLCVAELVPLRSVSPSLRQSALHPDRHSRLGTTSTSRSGELLAGLPGAHQVPVGRHHSEHASEALGGGASKVMPITSAVGEGERLQDAVVALNTVALVPPREPILGAVGHVYQARPALAVEDDRPARSGPRCPPVARPGLSGHPSEPSLQNWKKMKGGNRQWQAKKVKKWSGATGNRSGAALSALSCSHAGTVPAHPVTHTAADASPRSSRHYRDLGSMATEQVRSCQRAAPVSPC